MKKYGLNLRIPPSQQQKQKASKPPVAPPPAFAFKDDDNEEGVEMEISRQAAKNRALRKVEEVHKKALEEDPSVFDYDGHYDEMKEKIAQPRIQDKTERKSKYIETLMKKAKEREREHEIIYEKKILKERSKDDHLFADKEKFVTKAYKEKLAERERWMEEERLRQIREEKEDVTKKKDLSDFYFSLNKNVAFGARSEESTKPSKQEGPGDHIQETDSGSRPEATLHPTKGDKVRVRAEPNYQSESQTEHAATASEMVVESATSPQDKNHKRNTPEEETPKQTADVHKRSEEAVAAARERFLARKKAREQQQT